MSDTQSNPQTSLTPSQNDSPVSVSSGLGSSIESYSRFRESARRDWLFFRFKARRVISQFRHIWEQLTEGLELQDLWVQFRAEAEASTRLYRQDVAMKPIVTKRTWARPFKLFWNLSLAILGKLSPARRVFLLAILVLGALSIAGIRLLFISEHLEFLIAFGSLLVLLVMVLGDHVTMKRDIEIAREIQRWLVPRVPPDVPGIDMAFATRPAQMVAGDYYDAFRRAKDGPLLLAVADVSGKSVPAAMLMANFQASLRALAGQPCSLTQLVTNLNRLVCTNNSNGRRFTTAFLAELDPKSGELTYLSAGHNPPILFRQDGTVERLQAESIPLGIELSEEFPTNRTVLNPHDLLLIYTDGVPEARNSRREQFGEARLLAAIEPDPEDRAAGALTLIMRKLDEFVGSAMQHDDITCLVVKRK